MTIEKIIQPFLSYFLAMAFTGMLTVLYGRKTLEWILTKLYEFFIQKTQF